MIISCIEARQLADEQSYSRQIRRAAAEGRYQTVLEFDDETKAATVRAQLQTYGFYCSRVRSNERQNQNTVVYTMVVDWE